MNHLRFLAWSALMAKSMLATASPATSNSGTLEVDLIFPRNETYSPEGLMPIVFAVRNPVLTQVASAGITWSLWEGDNLTSPGSMTDAFLPLMPWDDQVNSTSSEPSFITRLINTTLYPDGIWTFSWTLALYNCSAHWQDPDTNLIVANNNITFTVSKSGQAPDLVAATSSEACGATVGYAYDIRGSRGMCALIGPNVTANPCSVSINSSTAASIMADATAFACSPLGFEYEPNVTCPIKGKKSSNAAGLSPMAAAAVAAAGWTWLSLLTLVTALNYLG
ncbi:hypothetical protein BO71DRAFT_403797 [Aspergillus ellipticus CBS 707.79]|uniref:DUF7136 domain-containing protein n=1 Tax=Aspergillus ellipticus CBS 707.79 TaxID=1448320 RepID=A0A319DBT4_9EURO|nr:hypothetical protein BO71DRAFT_403797 [Aspergillus ellipticus CBS 707.79]